MALSRSEELILGALVSAAEASAPCPIADDLAELIGSQSVSTTVGIMHRLESKGLIRVERYQRTRRVMIVATGKATREPKNKAMHWRKRPASMPAPSLSVVRTRSPDVAQVLASAARREDRGLADFLADLVWEGALARGLLDSPDDLKRAG
jgi:DNA-binding MarR family transcriptional regulator